MSVHDELKRGSEVGTVVSCSGKYLATSYSEGLCDFAQSQLLPPTDFPVRYSLIILTVYTVYCELITPS
jgi:hypothetical protein